ncbi:MAG TPA: hypothetical protein VLJ10_05770, partial [Candidatus Bathyarchaeia archaeon]|nr:hypothetical protein [Candidatus Bathyarchaeia archaeon]
MIENIKMIVKGTEQRGDKDSIPLPLRETGKAENDLIPLPLPACRQAGGKGAGGGGKGRKLSTLSVLRSPSSVFLFLVLLTLAGCSTVPITGRQQLSIIPSSQLVSMSNTSFAQLLKET